MMESQRTRSNEEHLATKELKLGDTIEKQHRPESFLPSEIKYLKKDISDFSYEKYYNEINLNKRLINANVGKYLDKLLPLAKDNSSNYSLELGNIPIKLELMDKISVEIDRRNTIGENIHNMCRVDSSKYKDEILRLQQEELKKIEEFNKEFVKFIQDKHLLPVMNTTDDEINTLLQNMENKRKTSQGNALKYLQGWIE